MSVTPAMHRIIAKKVALLVEDMHTVGLWGTEQQQAIACEIQAGGPHAPGGLLFDDDGGEHSCPYGCCEGENHGVVQRQHYYSYKVCANNHASAKSARQPVSS